MSPWPAAWHWRRVWRSPAWTCGAAVVPGAARRCASSANCPRPSRWACPRCQRWPSLNEGVTALVDGCIRRGRPRVRFDGLPQSVTVPAGGRVEIRYRGTAQRRGPARFGVTQLRLRTQGGSFEMLKALGRRKPCASIPTSPRSRATPGSPATADWRRSASRPMPMRGMGTDFRQLADYRRGDRSATSIGRPPCATAAHRARVPGRPRPARRLPARLRPPHAGR